MEFDVVREVVFIFPDILLDGLAQAGELSFFGVPDVQRGERGDLGLQHEPDVEKLQGKLVLVGVAGERERILVERLCADDIGAGAPADLQHALGHESPDRLADGAAADAEHVGQFKLGRDLVADIYGGGEDVFFELGFDVFAEKPVVYFFEFFHGESPFLLLLPV